MQAFLLARLALLSFFTLLEGALAAISVFIVSQGVGVMRSSFAPGLFYVVASSILGCAFATIVLIREGTVRFEMLSLSVLWILQLGNSMALTAILPFPVCSALSGKLAWMGEQTCYLMLISQILSWVALAALLAELLALVILSFIHSATCPQLLSWSVSHFEWSPLPPTAFFSRHRQGRGSVVIRVPGSPTAAQPQTRERSRSTSPRSGRPNFFASSFTNSLPHVPLPENTPGPIVDIGDPRPTSSFANFRPARPVHPYAYHQAGLSLSLSERSAMGGDLEAQTQDLHSDFYRPQIKLAPTTIEPPRAGAGAATATVTQPLRLKPRALVDGEPTDIIGTIDDDPFADPRRSLVLLGGPFLSAKKQRERPILAVSKGASAAGSGPPSGPGVERMYGM